MPVTSVLPEAVTVFDGLVTAKQTGGPARLGAYDPTNPAAVAAFFPLGPLAAQLSELTGPDGGNVGQVQAVRTQLEACQALARAEALRRSSKVRVSGFCARRRETAAKGLRLPIERAQTLLRVST